MPTGSAASPPRRYSTFGDVHLNMDGPANNDITVDYFFTSDSVDVFRFSDKTLTAQQVKNMIPSFSQGTAGQG